MFIEDLLSINSTFHSYLRPWFCDLDRRRYVKNPQISIGLNLGYGALTFWLYPPFNASTFKSQTLKD